MYKPHKFERHDSLTCSLAEILLELKFLFKTVVLNAFKFIS